MPACLGAKHKPETRTVIDQLQPLLLYYCGTTTVLLLYCCGTTTVLLLCYCGTTVGCLALSCPLCLPSQELLFRGAVLPLVGVNWLGILVSGSVFGTLHLTGDRNAVFAAWYAQQFVNVAYIVQRARTLHD